MENKEILKALIKVQTEIKPPKKDGVNPRFKNKYCTIDAIYDAIRKPLAESDLFLTHSVEWSDGRAWLRTSLVHTSGENLSNLVPLFIEAQTSQDMGKALTYARRYAICCLLALPGEEDDDGEAVSQLEKYNKALQKEEKHPLSDEQMKKIIEAAKHDGAKIHGLCKKLGASSLEQLRVLNPEHFTTFAIAELSK